MEQRPGPETLGKQFEYTELLQSLLYQGRCAVTNILSKEHSARVQQLFSNLLFYFGVRADSALIDRDAYRNQHPHNSNLRYGR